MDGLFTDGLFTDGLFTDGLFTDIYSDRLAALMFKVSEGNISLHLQLFFAICSSQWQQRTGRKGSQRGCHALTLEILFKSLLRCGQGVSWGGHSMFSISLCLAGYGPQSGTAVYHCL